jgi:hypothetical protein
MNIFDRFDSQQFENRNDLNLDRSAGREEQRADQFPEQKEGEQSSDQNDA